VVAHRDRLCRFAFELIEFIFSKTNSNLIVLDTEAGKSSDQELSEDILSIIHVYSCRSMGKRRYSNKKNSTVPQCEPEEDSEGMDWDDEVGVQPSR
jgi:predicted site-specific integrase-resolvase